MADRVVSDADTLELQRPRTLIARAPTAVTAFVGRTLKGPIDQPLPITSFAAYQRVFGGLWQSSTMSYAVQHYFENGGRECLIVRVVNGARPPTLTLPAGAHALTLIGRSPGTREYLRAAVDYDGIAAGDSTHFNLVIQRVHAPGSEHIEAQDIFRRVSITPGERRGIAELLSTSQLVRVHGALPPRRPDATQAPPPSAAVRYIGSNTDADDGDALSDYDLIGDPACGSGLFALRAGERPFDLLYLAPPTRERDVGLPALLVALRLCRERRALLLVDPPSSWDNAEAAIEGLRGWPLFSEDAWMVFPRLVALDRLRGRHEVFGSGAAAAAWVARSDERAPSWRGPGEPLLPRLGLQPALELTDLDRLRLAQGGVNCWQSVRHPAAAPSQARTLQPERAGGADGEELAARRLALFLMNSIERATRWVLLERAGPALWGRARAQVLAFLKALDAQGAFPVGGREQRYFVICDERLNRPAQAQEGFRLLFGFAGARRAQFQVCLVTHRPGESSVRPVSLNRYALPDG